MPRSDRDLLMLHLIFTGIVLLVLWVPYSGWQSGWRVGLLTLLYVGFVPAIGAARGHHSWRGLWLFALMLSICQVLPDRFLAEVLVVLVFAEDGFPKVGAVPVYMAGLWTIPIFVCLYVAERSTEVRRGSEIAGYVSAAVVGLVLFAGSEAISPLIPIWKAQGVANWGGIAHYVLPAEVALCAAALFAFRTTRNKNLAKRALAAFGTMLLYSGALAVCFLFLR